MARGLPDAVFGPGGQRPPAGPPQQPVNDLSRQLDSLGSGAGPVGAGPVGTVLPSQPMGAGAPQQPSVAPPAAVPSTAAPPAPAYDAPFFLIDLVAHEIVTGDGRRLGYPPELHTHFIKWCLKMELLHRNTALQRVAEEYGTSLEEVALELEEATRGTQNMPSVPDGAPSGGVQEDPAVAEADMQPLPKTEPEQKGG